MTTEKTRSKIKTKISADFQSRKQTTSVISNRNETKTETTGSILLTEATGSSFSTKSTLKPDIKKTTEKSYKCYSKQFRYSF